MLGWASQDTYQSGRNKAAKPFLMRHRKAEFRSLRVLSQGEEEYRSRRGFWSRGQAGQAVGARKSQLLGVAQAWEAVCLSCSCGRCTVKRIILKSLFLGVHGTSEFRLSSRTVHRTAHLQAVCWTTACWHANRVSPISWWFQAAGWDGAEMSKNGTSRHH